MRPNLARVLLILPLSLFTALGFAGPTLAQYNPNRPPWAQKEGSGTKNSSGKAGSQNSLPPGTLQDNSTIHVDVNLVNVLVSVLDVHNRPAPDLPVQDFQVYEEGRRQKIEVFERETQRPLDLALMIDASLSAELDMAEERSAADRFIQEVIRPGDRLAVYAFDQDVIQLSSFTDNVRELQSAVRRIPVGGGTSIYDALFLGSRALERQGGDRRRVILLITDGGETTSHTDFDTARNEAVKAGALLYTILIRAVKNENGRNTAGEHALQTITDMTGGAMFFPNQPGDLDAIFDQINRELRTQYRLGYYPSPRGPANTYRTIQVKVLGNYTVRHRKTYFTGPQ
jgi:Ca-activated chloride channel homolog